MLGCFRHDHDDPAAGVVFVPGEVAESALQVLGGAIQLTESVVERKH